MALSNSCPRRMMAMVGVLLAVALSPLTSCALEGDGDFVGYRNAESASWEQVRRAAMPMGRGPLSVHIPIGLPEASDILFCDCAFNVWKMPVPPDMKTGNDPRTKAIRDSLCLDLVSIALGEAPFVPEFRQTRWTRSKGGYPIVRGEIDAQYRNYAFEYCANPQNGEMYIRGTVRNDGSEPLKCVVRLRRSNPREKDICEYHYITYRWDAERWSTGDSIEPPEVVENNFDSVSDESQWSFDDSAYGIHPFFCGAPYFVHPSMRLKSGGRCIKFEANLHPGESRTFTVAAGFAENKPINHPHFDETLVVAKQFWDSHIRVQADFGNEKENDAFRNFQFCNLQLLINPWKDAKSAFLQPCQGGSSERFYVWVWEAMFSLRPMVQLGHFCEVRKVLEFILRLQDGGCPPEGEFTTLSGAIGTTGPRWASTTGSALMLATEYLECSGDEDFRIRHLDNLIRAAKWILGETKATRKIRSDGTREVGYGLMPGCIVNDGDRGIFFATTDSYSYAGVKRLSDFLVRTGHSEGAWMSAECARYKLDIDRTIDEVQCPNGFIPRMVGSDEGGSFEFRNIPGAFGLIYSGTIDPATDERIVRMVRFWEREHAVGPFLEPFDFSIRYVGNCESGLAKYYALRGEWKRAYFARQAFMNYAMTRDLGITGERFSEVDDGFTPWQPNASNKGRGLDMMIGRFFVDGGSRIVLMGGFAPFETGDVLISGIRTRYGLFSAKRTAGCLDARWEHPIAPGTAIVIPEYNMFATCDEKLKRIDKSSWLVIKPLTSIRGTIEINNNGDN